MRKVPLAILTLSLFPLAANAVGPTIYFSLPAPDATPAVIGSLPFPCDLYFDGGKPADGDGTLLASGATIGAGVIAQTNTASIEDALDLLDGFGTTTAVYFFVSGAIDPASLPATPVLSPSLSDAVFCAEAGTAVPVPIALKFDFDTRIRHVLAVLPLPGRPLKAKTTYTCVVRRGVTGAGEPVEPWPEWVSVRDAASANPDADAIFDPVVAVLAAAGVPASEIAAMTVFTTQSTTDDLLRIRDVVLPGLPTPTADLTSRPELVFQGAERLTALLGPTGHDHLGAVATGFYDSPRFQTLDPNGPGPLHDLPLPPTFVDCAEGFECETTDERFTRDPSGNPIVIDAPKIPFTVAVPNGARPPDGWPVIIQQHGLGGQRDTVLGFAEEDATRGFASIGIDAAQHGYRLFECGPGAPCGQDTANAVGGTAIPDGFADGAFAGFDVSFLAVNLGFFQAFHNFLGIRDNFRQTYADLLSLVRLIQGHSIDAALGTALDASRIFYMGHSLGGLMGSGFVPVDTTLKAALLNATGGGLTSQLFVNSSIGAGAFELVNGILGLDPANVGDQFAFLPNLTQTVLDPADGINSAGLLLAPTPHNVIQVEDFGDQVVPNQSNEALAVAAGLQIFDPFVQNLHQSPFMLPVAPTVRMIRGNAAGGTVTAALLQNGPATHAQSLITTAGGLNLVPEFAHVEDFLRTGDGFPALERPIRVPNAGILDEVLDWFADIAINGPPGTFAFADPPNFNPIQNLEAPAGPSTLRFFARTVSDGGAEPFSEPTPDVIVDFSLHPVASRVTAGRTILGSSSQPAEGDVPPGPLSSVGTPGFLPFFVTLQHAGLETFMANVTLAYTADELLLAGIPPGSETETALVVGTFRVGTCTLGGAACGEDEDCGANGPCAGAHYQPFTTTVDPTAQTVTASGLSAFSTLAVFHPGVLGGQPIVPLVAGPGRRRTECRLQWEVVNPRNTPFEVGGRLNVEQSCRDGDPTCDADRTADGTCVFRVALCFNHAASALRCRGRKTSAFVLTTPSARSADPFDQANAQALIEGLETLGGRPVGRRGAVRFRPRLTSPVCTPLTEFRAPAGAERPLRGAVSRDRDRLLLRCLPPS